MAVELIVPQVGESITEVQIVQWLKNVGDRVERDANLAVIETDKATVEFPAPVAGILSKVLVDKGATAKVGDVIGYIEEGPAAKGGGAKGGAVKGGSEKSSAAPASAKPPAAKGDPA